MRIPWANFFDLESLQRYVPVIEFHDWKEITGGEVGAVYYLQGYKAGVELRPFFTKILAWTTFVLFSCPLTAL